MGRSASIVFALVSMLLALLGRYSHAEESQVDPISIKVQAEVQHTLDPRIFGQFLERPSWGETGPELAASQFGELPSDIVTLLREMNIPIVRFPGGTDIDYIDWTDMISNAPGRASDRPITTGHQGHKVSNRFGLDEYFKLSEELGWESIIVVNLLDGLAKKKPLAEAALHAAGLVAYCNAPVGTTLPRGMPDWPAIRALNGHPKPYNVSIFQLGNEWWMHRFREEAKAGAGSEDPKIIAAWYRQCILAFVDAMRAVDPSIKLIVDGKMGDDLEKTILPDPQIRNQIEYVTFHKYAPGMMYQVKHDDEPVDPDTLTPEEWFLAWSAMPGQFDEEGRNIAFGEKLDLARNLGYEIAATEWNWNGWGSQESQPTSELEWRHAAAVGVAGFLNGMIRQADVIRIANQSMLIGHNWDISAIRYDPDGKIPTHLNAQSMVTTFYNKHHGENVIEVTLARVPKVKQPYAIGWNSALPTVALLDVVATSSQKSVFVHIVNRSFDTDIETEFDLTALMSGNVKAILHILEGVAAEQMPKKQGWMQDYTSIVAIKQGQAHLTIPKKSVAILEVPLEPYYY